jgi:hypothetical protein
LRCFQNLWINSEWISLALHKLSDQQSEMIEFSICQRPLGVEATGVHDW